MKASKQTIIRSAVLMLSIINQILLVMGKELLPITDKQLNLYISTAFAVITSLIAWWKNNSFTKEAIKADGVMKKLKQER